MFAIEPSSFPVWRLMLAAQIVHEHYPELLPALHEALGPALEIVDTALGDITDVDSIAALKMGRSIKLEFNRRFLMRLQERRRGRSPGEEKVNA